jgi:carbon storage regulator
MLILTRKQGERIVIGDNIVLEVIVARGNKVKLGISAPADTRILRAELLNSLQPQEYELAVHKD